MLPQSSISYNSTYDYYNIAANASGRLIVKILNIHGRIAKTISQTVAEDVQILSIKIDDLQEGKYVFNIFNEGNFVEAVRYIKN